MRFIGIFLVLISLTFLLTGCSSSEVDLNQTFIDYSKPRVDYPSEEVVNEPDLVVEDVPKEIFELKDSNFNIMSYFITMDEYKAENLNVRMGLKGILSDFDLVFLQGVDAEASEYIAGLSHPNQRLSPVSNGERYILMYNNRLSVVNSYSYQGEDFKYPPYISEITLNNKTITFIQVRINEENAGQEIENLQLVIDSIDSDNIVIIGTLFADCIYYNGDALKEYDWMLELDTLIGVSDCSYDEIINVGSKKDFIKKTGVNKLESVDTELVSAISNHYPIILEIFY